MNFGTFVVPVVNVTRAKVMYTYMYFATGNCGNKIANNAFKIAVSQDLIKIQLKFCVKFLDTMTLLIIQF